MNAVSAGSARCTLPAREMSSRSSTRKARVRSPSNTALSPVCAAKVPMRSSARRSVYRKGSTEPARDAQQLVAVLVADAQRHGHGNDAAEDRGPKHVDELLVVAEEQDQLVAAARAESLQWYRIPSARSYSSPNDTSRASSSAA